MSETAKIIELLSTEFDRPEAVPASHLYLDLHFTSIDLIAFVWALEENHDISIPDEDADKWLTVKDVIDYVEKNK